MFGGYVGNNLLKKFRTHREALLFWHYDRGGDCLWECDYWVVVKQRQCVLDCDLWFLDCSFKTLCDFNHFQHAQSCKELIDDLHHLLLELGFSTLVHEKFMQLACRKFKILRQLMRKQLH